MPFTDFPFIHPSAHPFIPVYYDELLLFSTLKEKNSNNLFIFHERFILSYLAPFSVPTGVSSVDANGASTINIAWITEDGLAQDVAVLFPGGGGLIGPLQRPHTHACGSCRLLWRCAKATLAGRNRRLKGTSGGFTFTHCSHSYRQVFLETLTFSVIYTLKYMFGAI